MVIAIAAVDKRDTRCVQTIDPSIVTTVFREDGEYVTEIIRLATQSLREHLSSDQSLATWPPPVEGVFLGAEQETMSSDIDELVRRAAPCRPCFAVTTSSPGHREGVPAQEIADTSLFTP